MRSKGLCEKNVKRNLFLFFSLVVTLFLFSPQRVSAIVEGVDSTALFFAGQTAPLIVSECPVDDGRYYQQLQINISFYSNNGNITDIYLKVYNKSDDLTYSQHETPNQKIAYITDTIPSSNLTLGYNRLNINAINENSTERIVDYNFYIMNCVELTEDWVQGFGACNKSDEQLKFWSDLNNCGTMLDNTTLLVSEVVACNYCTSAWGAVIGECNHPTGNKNYEWHNFTYTNTCCADTGLPSDCNKPVNELNACGYYAGTCKDAGCLISIIEDGIGTAGAGVVDWLKALWSGD